MIANNDRHRVVKYQLMKPSLNLSVFNIFPKWLGVLDVWNFIQKSVNSL